jgi:hypothetical protein
MVITIDQPAMGPLNMLWSVDLPFRDRSIDCSCSLSCCLCLGPFSTSIVTRDTMQYPPTGNTHLPVSKKNISPYKMPFFNYTVNSPDRSYLIETNIIFLRIFRCSIISHWFLDDVSGLAARH